MNIYFSTNLKLLRKRLKRTQDEVSFSTGIKRPTLSGYENSGVLPGIESLLALSDYFGVAADTLLRIDLRQLSEFQLSQLERGSDVFIKGSNIRVLASTTDSHNRENIEMVGQKVKAGYTLGFSDPEYINELPRFQLPFLSHNKKYRSFQIQGDSMEPIPEGAWIISEYLQDWQQIISGKAHIILTLNDGVVFKIVENHIEKDGNLRLTSLNPLYESYNVHISEVKEVWRFINYISDKIPESGFTAQSFNRSLQEIKKDVRVIKKQVMGKNG